MNDALRSPIADGVMSQLSTGMAGVAFMTLDIPLDDTSDQTVGNGTDGNGTGVTYHRKTVALGLTTSGRLLSLVLDLQPQKRHGIFGSQKKENKETLFGSNVDALLEDILRRVELPTSSSSQNPGPVPTFKLFTDTAQLGIEDELKEVGKKVTKEGDRRINWSLLSQPTVENLRGILQNSRESGAKQSASLFGRRVISAMKSAQHRCLHEYLNSNEDSLVHASHAWKSDYHRDFRKIETVAFWRHPELDAIYWPEVSYHKQINIDMTDSQLL